MFKRRKPRKPKPYLTALVLIACLAVSGCANSPSLPGVLKASKTILNNSDEITKPLSGETPSRLNYCGSNVGCDWTQDSTCPVPKDGLDAICALHDEETGCALRNSNPISKAMGWNSASKFFTDRLKKQDEVVEWTEKFWAAKHNIGVDIQTTPEDDDYYRLYKPGARLLFKFIYIPWLKKASLLDGCIDETVAGKPPR